MREREPSWLSCPTWTSECGNHKHWGSEITYMFTRGQTRDPHPSIIVVYGHRLIWSTKAWHGGFLMKPADVKSLIGLDRFATCQEIQSAILLSAPFDTETVSYTHLRAHETGRNLVCRLLLEKKK